MTEAKGLCTAGITYMDGQAMYKVFLSFSHFHAFYCLVYPIER